MKNNAGKTPTWNEEFMLEAHSYDVIHLSAFDDDYEKDDKIGEGEIRI